MNSRSSTRPGQTSRASPPAITAATACGSRGIAISFASTLAVPRGITASGRAWSRMPLATAFTVPSPPAATMTSNSASASRARRSASPGAGVVARTSTAQSRRRNSATTLEKYPERAPPAAGLMITSSRRGRSGVSHSLRCGRLRVGDGLDQLQELAARVVIGHRVIYPHQLDRLRALQMFAPFPLLAGEVLQVEVHVGVEIADRHVENLADGREAGSADAVGAALVFLHLLKGQAEPRGQSLLVHAEQQAPHADAAADMDIDRVRCAGAASIWPRRRRSGASRFRHNFLAFIVAARLGNIAQPRRDGKAAAVSSRPARVAAGAGAGRRGRPRRGSRAPGADGRLVPGPRAEPAAGPPFGQRPRRPPS